MLGETMEELVDQKDSVHSATHMPLLVSVTPAVNEVSTITSSWSPRLRLSLSSCGAEQLLSVPLSEEIADKTTMRTWGTDNPLPIVNLHQDQEKTKILQLELIKVEGEGGDICGDFFGIEELSNDDTKLANSSCRYCGDYFFQTDDCVPDLIDPSACKACAKQFGSSGNGLEICSKTEVCDQHVHIPTSGRLNIHERTLGTNFDAHKEVVCGFEQIEEAADITGIGLTISIADRHEVRNDVVANQDRRNEESAFPVIVTVTTLSDQAAENIKLPGKPEYGGKDSSRVEGHTEEDSLPSTPARFASVAPEKLVSPEAASGRSFAHKLRSMPPNPVFTKSSACQHRSQPQENTRSLPPFTTSRPGRTQVIRCSDQQGIQGEGELLYIRSTSCYCPGCMEEFNKRRMQLKCHQCPILFLRTEDVKNHEEGHTQRMPLLCMTCGQWFRWLPLLMQHMKQSHRLC